MRQGNGRAGFAAAGPAAGAGRTRGPDLLYRFTADGPRQAKRPVQPESLWQGLARFLRINLLPKRPPLPACAALGWLFVRFYRYGELSGERQSSVMI